jgi:hypothetical protein
VYALYYTGSLSFYRELAQSMATERPRPIYVGKAIPKGGRTGGLGFGDVITHALYDRLRKHARSIDMADDLQRSDFQVRYLALDDVWIPLGENMLIETYQPVWNKVIAGFGNNPPGQGRVAQKVSLWDILHPGRAAIAQAKQAITREDLQLRAAAFLRGEDVPQVESRDDDEPNSEG